MYKTLGEIANLVGGEVIGDRQIKIKRLRSIQNAVEGDLSFIANSKYLSLVKTTKASALITDRTFEFDGKAIIRTDNPSFAFASVSSHMSKENAVTSFPGVHKTAVIADDVSIGENVSIGPYAVVERSCVIGSGACIGGHCYVAHHSTVGEDVRLYPQVMIREYSQIGARVIIHSGTVVGSDGFGYEQINGQHMKVPQIGSVVIEDDVEIGANVTIDRARFESTRIGRGTKIDNLVQIGHNVQIGEHCIIISQCGISGSSEIGRQTIIAGQAGLAGHIKIGEGSVIASQAGVTKSLPPGSKVSGYPAKPHEQAKRINAHVQRLPKYVRQMTEQQREIERLNALLERHNIK